MLGQGRLDNFGASGQNFQLPPPPKKVLAFYFYRAFEPPLSLEKIAHYPPSELFYWSELLI